MSSDRWYVRSLRRFQDFEITLYVYLAVGGVCSAIYFAGAIVHTRFYTYIFASHSLEQAKILVNIAVQICVHAIFRCVLWLPEFFWQVVMGGERFWDWLTAADILKTLS